MFDCNSFSQKGFLFNVGNKCSRCSLTHKHPLPHAHPIRNRVLITSYHLAGDGLKWGRDFFADNGFLEQDEVDLSRVKGPGRGKLHRRPVKERTLTHEVEEVLTAEAAR